MSLWHIAWSYLWNRKLTTVLTIFSVALGVGLISTVLTLREETKRRFEEVGQDFDVVIGAKQNSPLGLVLSTVYYMGQYKGNIPASVLKRVQQEEEVKAAFPIGLGDSYRRYRIVGTVPDLFEFNFSRDPEKTVKPFVFAQGRCFEKPFDAVLGAGVAASTKLGVGDTFISTHGFVGGHEHDEFPYTVVGILRRTGKPYDRAIFCDMDSIWQVHASHDSGEGHDHGDEVTAILVRLQTVALRGEFNRRVNSDYNIMGVVPVEEIRQLYDELLGMAKAVLLSIGYLVAVISSISILIGLYMAILQRKRDLAVMRALGASKGEIFGGVLIEAFWVTLLGLIAGWFVGTASCWLLGQYLVRRVGFHVSAINVNPDLVTAYSAVILMGLIAGILPAWQAYRTDVARDLAEL